MRFPHTVTILRPAGEDEYGNPSASFETARRIDVKAFVLGDSTWMLEPTADIRVGDRIEFEGKQYSQEPTAVRSARGIKLVALAVAALDVQP